MHLLRFIAHAIAHATLSVVTVLCLVTACVLFVAISLGILYLADDTAMTLGWISP